MKKSIKKNYLYNLLNQLLVIVVPFITIPYLSRVLNADGIGIYSYIHSIVSYFTLFAILGVSTYGQREISYVQNNVKQRSVVFWETKIFQIITSLIMLVIYLAFSLFQEERLLYMIFAFNILSVAADVSWFFYGLEEFGKIIIRNAVLKLTNLLFIFVFVKTKDDLFIYCLGMCFFDFISNLSLWGYIPRYVQKVKFKRLRPFVNIRIIISLFIPTIAIQIYTALDKTMIGFITHSAYENGYYEQAIGISRVVLTFVTALGTVMIPRIGCLFQEGDKEGIKNAIYRGYRFVWFLGIPLCLGLIGISANFVPWFYGEGFDKVIPLLEILSLLIIAIGISNVTGMQYLIPTKRQNVLTLTLIIGAITNFLLNCVLIRFYQSIGAAIASVVSETMIAILQLIFVRKELDWKKIIVCGWKYVIAGGVMLVAIKMLASELSPNIIHTIVISLIGANTYFAVLIILKDLFFLNNCKSVMEILKTLMK